MELTGMATKIPSSNNIKEILQFVAGAPPSLCFIGDQPRALGKMNKKLGEYFAGIEQIKSGVVYDGRYTTVIRGILIPVIWIFCNEPLPFDCITPKRLKIWQIGPKKLLERIG